MRSANISHRVRLAIISALLTGAVLAALFGGIVVATRGYMLKERRTVLVKALDSLTIDKEEAFDPAEFRMAHPDLSCTVVDHGRITTNGTPLPILTGYQRRKELLVYGKVFRGQTIVVGYNWGETERSLRLLALTLSGLWLPLVLMIGAATYFVARSVFRPLQRLTAQAASAAGSDLTSRLETDDRSEFGEFADALNQMLDRIESEVRRSDRFAEDAAHEMRTPLAILRTRIETTLLKERAPEEYVSALTRALDEIKRLTEVTQSLLRTARGEAAETPTLDLGPACAAIADAWRDRFAEANVRLETDLGDAAAAIAPEELRITLDNLFDNALRFTPPGSRVLLTVGERDDWVEVSVADEGPGFPAHLGDRAFDRLTRGDDSRNRSSGGAGIGLSVVRRIAESRGGKAFLGKSSGAGAFVVVQIPAAKRA